MKYVSSEQMRNLDRIAIEEYGIPGVVLMENAGREAFKVAMEMLKDRPINCTTALVLCGPGNNGGDGYVVARYLVNAGIDVTVLHFGDLEKVRGDASINMQIALKMGIPVLANPGDEELHITVERSDLVIDAMLGTGSQGAARGKILKAIREVNASKRPVLALDMPSGIDVDTGKVVGDCITAEVTVTFGLPKIGLICQPAMTHVGRLVVADIGIPYTEMNAVDCVARSITSEEGKIGIPVRFADSHKGSFGHMAVVAGSTGMSGAAVLSALGGLRVGTGLVTAIVPETINQIFEMKVTEAMSVPIPDSKGGRFSADSSSQVLDILDSMDAVVIGPGIGRDEGTVSFVMDMVQSAHCPTVLDADALYAVSNDLSVLKNAAAEIVLTPHPGEMSRLLGTSVAEVQSNRVEAASKLAQEYSVTVVLKGQGTVVAAKEGLQFINTTGCSGMSSGGVGDVLAGMIGGLIAQGVPSVEAALSGVFVHGFAGMLASARLGEEAMLAGDLVDDIGNAINQLFGRK